MLYKVMLVRVKWVANHETGSYVTTLIVCVILFALLGFALKNFIQIIGTSIIGAFIMMRSVGLMADNYPDYKEISR